jgi:hypothetical protein
VTKGGFREGHPLRAAFSDGAVKDIDLGDLLSAGGVFTPIYERREARGSWPGWSPWR